MGGRYFSVFISSVVATKWLSIGYQLAVKWLSSGFQVADKWLPIYICTQILTAGNSDNSKFQCCGCRSGYRNKPSDLYGMYSRLTEGS